MKELGKANVLILSPQELFQTHPRASEKQLSPKRKQEEQSVGLGGLAEFPL